jgi:hypothetical protein
LIATFLLFFQISAFAQTQPMLFVPPVKTADPSLFNLAKVVDKQLEEQLSQHFRILNIDSVPEYEDYGADVYLDACPPYEDIGCVYVLANRVSAPIAVSLGLSRRADEKMLIVTILDVVAATKAVAFTMNLTDENTPTAVNVVVRALQAFGVQENQDIRTPSKTKEFNEERIAHVAQALEVLGVGVFLEEQVRSEIDSPKFTVADLASWLETDAVTPWEQAGLSQRQFIRYKNANTTLERWLSRSRGTSGSVVVESAFGFIYGPYHQNFSASYLLNPTNIGNGTEFIVQRMEVASGVTDAMVGQGALSVGVGVHATTEILGTVSWYTGRYAYLEQQEVAGDDTTFPAQSVNRAKSSRAIGLQVNVTPLPDLFVRPTLTTTVKYWRGVPVEEAWEISDYIDPIAAPNLWLMSIEPGLSASLSPKVSVFLRGQLGFSMGALYTQSETGGSELSLPVEIIEPSRTSFGLILGASTQIGPLFGSRNDSGENK